MIYSIFNIVLAIVYRSFWFLTLGIYYFSLGCMRGALAAHGRSQKDKRTSAVVVRHVGIVFFPLAVIFSGNVVLSIYENHSTAYGIVVMLAIAAFTFYLFTMAIINIVRSRKSGSLKLMALRNISLGGALVSMFSLEKSMLATFTDNAPDYITHMEMYTGAGIFAALIALGINLIIISRRVNPTMK